MATTERLLLVLHEDAGLREATSSLMERGWAVQYVDDWQEMLAAAEDAPPTVVAIADPYRQSRGRYVGLRQFLYSYPSVPLIVATELSSSVGDDLRRLGQLGVVDVIGLGFDDSPRALAERVQDAQARPLRVLVERATPVDFPGRGRLILDTAARVVARGGEPADLHEELGVPRTTLVVWCERAGLPTPRRLLVWMRVLFAAELLDDPGRSIQSVARAVGYSSSSGLRRVTATVLAESPGEMRERGAFRLALEGFLKVLKTSSRPTTTETSD